MSILPSLGSMANDKNAPDFQEYNSLRPVPYFFSLDVLRGLAVTVSLLTGIWAFGGFTANQQNGVLSTTHSKDHVLYVVVSWLVEGKMRAIISLVFGAGMVIFLAGSNTKNEVPVPDLFVRRQLWLIIFGLINGLLLLSTGDVLFHLGIFGIMLFPFARLSFRALLAASLIVTLVYSAKNLWSFSEDRSAYNKYTAVVAAEKKIAAKKSTDSLSKKQKDDKSAWEDIAAGLKYDPKKDDAGYKAMRSVSYAKVWNHAIPALQKNESQWTYSMGIWDFSGLILLGMALYKAGLFHRSFSNRIYLLIGVTAMIVGLLMAWFRLHFTYIAVTDYANYVTTHWFPYALLFPFERLFMSVGYCCIVMLMIQFRAISFIWKAFAAAGRLALSNYILQSIFCSLFFAGFGMGYYGVLKQYQLYFLTTEIVLVQIVFSVCWLKFYQAGPVEWLLRCLMYGKWLPNKTSPTITESETVPAFN